MSCVKQKTKKYTSRPSPPFPANECCGWVLKGNDMKPYESVSDKNGRCRWVLVKTYNTSKISKKSRKSRKVSRKVKKSRKISKKSRKVSRKSRKVRKVSRK